MFSKISSGIEKLFPDFRLAWPFVVGTSRPNDLQHIWNVGFGRHQNSTPNREPKRRCHWRRRRWKASQRDVSRGHFKRVGYPRFPGFKSQNLKLTIWMFCTTCFAVMKCFKKNWNKNKSILFLQFIVNFFQSSRIVRIVGTKFCWFHLFCFSHRIFLF